MKLREKLNMAGLSKMRFVLLPVVSTILIAGCGGAPSENPNVGGGSSGLDTRTIVLSVEGSSGTVVVRVNEDDYTFTSDGSEQIAGFGIDDDVQATIISNPDGESCSFAPHNQQQVVVSTRATVECGGGAVSGKVKNFFTNEEISGATVSVTQADTGGFTFLTAALTNSAGEYGFDAAIVEDEMTVVTVSADGYAPFTAVVQPSELRPEVTENIFLVPRNLTDTETPTEDMTFRISGIPVLEIPANGLETAEGAAPTGDVTATITLLDPSFSPKMLPGRYSVLDAGVESWSESFGGISFELRDSADNLLVLAGGVTADLIVPSGAGIEEAPTEADIFSFNANTGYWEPASDATISTFGVYTTFEASVSQLSSTFMAGIAYSPALLSGVVVDSSGNPYAGVTVVAQGRDYLGLSYSTTSEDGVFSVPAKAGAEVLIYSIAGTQSRTVEATNSGGVTGLRVALDPDSTTITLTWGENPVDLDSHLFGPSGEEEPFHVYFAEKEVTVGATTIFLDVDDVTSFGPEVTTIPAFPLSGRYSFLVFLFSGTSTIQLSPARVELNLQGENYVFSPPSGIATECWHVFDIDVDSALLGTLVERDDWTTGSACNSGPSGTGFSKPQLNGGSPAMDAILRKYYADPILR